MTESAYLKEELGAVLARGLAAVAMAKPQDPVEYLALWLLHDQQNKARKQKEVDVQRELEGEREEWTKGRAQREKAATAIIQREWKAHISATKERQLKESNLRKVFATVEESADEQVQEEQPAEGDKTEAERDAEANRLASAAVFQRSKLFVAELSKSYVADFKSINASNTHAVMVLRCCFYLMGLRPRQVDTWTKIKNLIKPFPMCQWMMSFQPCGTPLERKRKMIRVRRLLTTVNEEAVKKEGSALHAVYQWVAGASAFREARDEHIKARRAAGKEAEEELDEEEEFEDEEKDADEEVVKAAEAEAARIAAEEAAAAAAEGEGGEPTEE